MNVLYVFGLKIGIMGKELLANKEIKADRIKIFRRKFIARLRWLFNTAYYKNTKTFRIQKFYI